MLLTTEITLASSFVIPETSDLTFVAPKNSIEREYVLGVDKFGQTVKVTQFMLPGNESEASNLVYLTFKKNGDPEFSSLRGSVQLFITCNKESLTAIILSFRDATIAYSDLPGGTMVRDIACYVGKYGSSK